MERLSISPGAAAAVDEYLEYRRVVGEDDGGILFTPEEYEEYKTKVLPMRLRNRLYVSWRSPTGMDCKLVGPETLCFCTHRYKQHKTDFEVIPPERPISLPCKVSQCPCSAFYYVPLNGTQPIRCRCKHFADQHSADPERACRACAPSLEALGSPVIAMDHPFLRAHQGPSSSLQGTSNQDSSLRRPDEDDMAYFERRYQERLKMEKAAKKKTAGALPSKMKQKDEKK
ncbi:protein FAM221A isoform X2 [Monodelphis domestica]|uniref:protein FAM221A isoform X2 n=1 Tax=Monodelphis domestica TaxID=13616 RepID=UPI0004434369|nr:protein FAM221A isoform X2 [Monodelphis domestica]